MGHHFNCCLYLGPQGLSCLFPYVIYQEIKNQFVRNNCEVPQDFLNFLLLTTKANGQFLVM